MKPNPRFTRFLDTFIRRHADNPRGTAVLSLCAAYLAGVPVARLICKQNVLDFEQDALIARSSGDVEFLRVFALKGSKRKVCYLPYRGQASYDYPMVAPRGYTLTKPVVVSAEDRRRELVTATVPTNRTWVDIAPLPKR